MILTQTCRMIAMGIVLGAILANSGLAQESPPAGVRPYKERWKRSHQQCWCGSPEESSEPPLGRPLDAHITAQIANGEAARMVLYDYDFVEGTDKLNPRGRHQLSKIAGLLPKNFFPVVIETTPKVPALAESRRLAVLRELGQGPLPVPTERVIVSPPPANGLQGVEGRRVYENLLQQTTKKGAYGATSGAGALIPPTNVGTPVQAGTGSPNL